MNYYIGNKKIYWLNDKPKKGETYIGVIAIGPAANKYPYFFFSTNKHVKDLSAREVDKLMQQSCSLYPKIKKIVKNQKSNSNFSKNDYFKEKIVGIFEII